jgi:hypothetical protein
MSMMMGDGYSGGMPGDMGEMGMPGSDMMGGYGYGGPKDPQLDLYRRRIKYEIQCVKQGLAGVKRLAAPKSTQEAAIARIEKEIEPIEKATDPPPMAQTLVAFHKSIKDSLFKLEGLTASVMPKPPATESTTPKTPASAQPPSDEPTLRTNVTASAKKPNQGAKPQAGGMRSATPPGGGGGTAKSFPGKAKK